MGDPHEMVRDRKGKLSHKDGRPVAYGPHGPRSCGIDSEEVNKIRSSRKKTEEPKKAEEPKNESVPKKDMKPEENLKGYKTRDLKGSK